MNRKPYFPIFVDLSNKKILVIGGGRIAARRVKTLLDFAGQIIVVAPEISEEIRGAAGESDNLLLNCRLYEASDLEHADIVIVATTDHSLNEEIGKDCRKRSIPVNLSHDQTLCDFYFPGLVKKDNIVIGVTSSGTDHAGARAVTEQLKAIFEK